MKNWQKTTTGTPSKDKVYVAVPAATEATSKEVKKITKETLLTISRRYSIDDNGGGYKGL